MPTLPPAALLALALQHAPQVAPETMLAVIQAESGGDPFAIYDNTAKQSHRPATKAEAVATARRLLGRGHNIDSGLAQVNSANFARMGLTVETAFEQGESVRAGGAILTEAYRRCEPGRTPLEALRCALSIYNTGRSAAGIINGYVAKVWKAADVIVPAIRSAGPLPSPSPPPQDDDPSDPAPPSWDTFARVEWEIRMEERRSAPVTTVRRIKE
ncbi:MAG: lytic transglycosylase domain-containing protein [Acetobacteraceae bacterium]